MMHRAFRFQLRINKSVAALLPLVVLTLGTTSLPAAVRAVLPGCCSSVVTLTAADPKTGLTRNTLTIGPLFSSDVRALDFALSPDGAEAYVLFEVSDGPGYVNSLARISLLKDQVAVTVPVDGSGVAVAVNPMTHVVYVTSTKGAGAYTLAALDPSSLATIESATGLPLAPEMTVSPQGDRIYFGAQSSGVFQVISTSDLSLLATVMEPDGGLPVPSPDGSTLYVLSSSYQNPASVIFVDANSFQTIKTVPLLNTRFLDYGSVSPDGATLYFAEYDDEYHTNYLGVLNLRTLVGASVPVPLEIGNMSVAPDGSAVYMGSAIEELGYFVGEDGAEIYNTSSQTVAAYGGLSSEKVAINHAGTMLYELEYRTVSAALLGPEPSHTVVASAPTGEAPGQGAYDPTTGLVLIPFDNQVGTMTLAPFATGNTMAFPEDIGLVLANAGTAYAFADNGYSEFTVYKFDPASLRPLGSLIVGYGDITGAALSPDGSRIYAVSTYSLNIINARPEDSPYSTTSLCIIDTATMQLVSTKYRAFAATGGLAVAPDGSAGYYVSIAQLGASLLVRFDLNNGAILGTMRIPGAVETSPSNPVVSLDSSLVYIASGSRLFAIDAKTLSLSATTPTPSPSAVLTLSPDGLYLYGSGYSAYAIYSTSDLSLVGTISSGTGIAPILIGQ